RGSSFAARPRNRRCTQAPRKLFPVVRSAPSRQNETPAPSRARIFRLKMAWRSSTFACANRALSSTQNAFHGPVRDGKACMIAPLNGGGTVKPMPLALVAAFSAALPAGGASAADTSPSKPIRIVVPYAAGGGPDVATRQFAQTLAPIIG